MDFLFLPLLCRRQRRKLLKKSNVDTILASKDLKQNLQSRINPTPKLAVHWKSTFSDLLKASWSLCHVFCQKIKEASLTLAKRCYYRLNELSKMKKEVKVYRELSSSSSLSFRFPRRNRSLILICLKKLKVRCLCKKEKQKLESLS